MNLKKIFTGYWVVPFSWLFLIFFLYSWFGKVYTDESFALFSLGKNLVAGNGFSSSAVRDFYISVSEPWYSRSFAPLFPLLIGIIDKITGAGVASGLIVNIILLFFILHVAYSMSTKVPGARGHFLFLAVLLFLCWNQPMLNEVVRAGTFPLFLLLVMCVAHFLTWKRYFKGLSSSICIGGLLGLMVLTRFDAIIFCLLFPLTYFFDSKDKLKKTLHAYAGLLIVISPWMIRNWMVFHNLFAYDNLMSMISITNESWALNFYENGAQTFSSNPSMWISQRFGNLARCIGIFIREIQIPGVALLIGLLVISIKKIRDRQMWSSIHIFTGVWVVCNFITTALFPFHESRLFSISILLLLLCLIHDLIRFGNKSMVLKPSLSRKGRLAWTICVSILMFATIHTLRKTIYAVHPKMESTYTELAEDFGPFTREHLIASHNPETLNYFSNWRTIHIPLNTNGFDDNFIAWVKAWNVTHLLFDMDSVQGAQYAFLDSKTYKEFKPKKLGSFYLVDLKPLVQPKKIETPSKPKRPTSPAKISKRQRS